MNDTAARIASAPGWAILGEEFDDAMAVAATEGRELELAPSRVGDTVADDASAGAPVETEAKKDHDHWVLACIRTDFSHDPGHMTLCARRRITGDIVLGPYAISKLAPTAANLTGTLRGHRWVFNRVITGDNLPDANGVIKRPGKSVVGTPATSLIHRVETTCTKCGTVENEWVDALIVRSRKARKGIEGAANDHWAETAYATCRQPAGTVDGVPVKCGGTLIQRKLWCSALATGAPNEDPILQGNTGVTGEMLPVSTVIQSAMLKVWKAGPPTATGEGYRLVLPRIWGAYELASLPASDWAPQTQREHKLVAAGKQLAYMEEGKPVHRPVSPLPFSISKTFQTPKNTCNALYEFWFDALPISVGWVRFEDLVSDEDGWRRRFWRMPQAENARGRGPQLKAAGAMRP